MITTLFLISVALHPDFVALPFYIILIFLKYNKQSKFGDNSMLEVVIDGNDNNEFCGKEYPVIETNYTIPQSWSEYKQIAHKIITDNSVETAVILKISNSGISLNKIALALFVEAIQTPNRLEFAVFKVHDLHEAREKYKPYIALTIAIKYALNLANETPKDVYKNISAKVKKDSKKKDSSLFLFSIFCDFFSFFMISF